MFKEERFENLLKSLRVRQGKAWTQASTAQSLGVSLRTYVGWENGESLPQRRDLKNIAALFQLSEIDNETLFRAAGSFAPKIQNLPFPPNPFFTGRESELVLMSQLFETNERITITQPISISGLGGIGKTALALEYAHRNHPHVYSSVLWVNAADRASLEASYLTLAHLLHLPEREEQQVERIVQAVKGWLEEYSRWLLILDNSDDLPLAHSFLPTKPRGHILLTTRSQIVGGLATQLCVDAFDAASGLLFLLRRSGLRPLANTETSVEAEIEEQAAALVQLLEGHPLALDQAGAYLEETGASLSDYHQLYQQERSRLLERRGWRGNEHPEAVATTLSISMKKACTLHPRCAEVLSFCALLHPDAIPEELLQAASGLHLDLLIFNDVMAALRNYSLIKRDGKQKTLSLHRLVQAVIKDGMEKETLRQWAKLVVQAVNAAFPEAEFEQWSRCEQLLPHAQLCATWIEREVVAPAEAAHLLHKAGNYLLERGQYPDAQPLYQQSLAICEKHLGVDHPDTAQSLHNLAMLYGEQGKYEQAEPLYLRALAIREQHLGADHSDTARSLNNLAILYWRQGKYEQAEPLYLRAIAIKEQHLGVEHPDTAASLHNLAILYREQGKYEQAEPLFLQSLAICEQHSGTDHPDTAMRLNNLAVLYCQQGKYEQAEPLYLRTLAIREQHLGAEHPYTARGLNNLAELYRLQGKYEQAEPLYLRVLAIQEQHLGADHPDTAMSLNNLAELYRQQSKYEQAEPLYLRALAIREQHLGADHPDTAMSLNNLAIIYKEQGKYEQAEPLYQRALLIWEHRLGAEHPNIAEALHGLAELYQEQGKYEQAEPLYQRALHIREQRLGPVHPETEKTRRIYAALLRTTERDEPAKVAGTDDKPLAKEGHE